MQQLNLSKDVVDFLLEFACEVEARDGGMLDRENENLINAVLEVASQLKATTPPGVDPVLFGEYIQSKTTLEYQEWLEYEVVNSRKREMKWIPIEEDTDFEYDKYYLFSMLSGDVWHFQNFHISQSRDDASILVNGWNLRVLVETMGWTHYAKGLKY